MTVINGVATFSNLSVSAVGTGYTLLPNSGPLTGLPSNAFNVTGTPSGTVIESFESSNTYTIAGGRAISGTRTAAAAHDGSFGFDDANGNDWIYRTDAPAQIKVGDQLSAWLKFANAADGRAYLGFCTRLREPSRWSRPPTPANSFCRACRDSPTLSIWLQSIRHLPPTTGIVWKSILAPTEQSWASYSIATARH